MDEVKCDTSLAPVGVGELSRLWRLQLSLGLLTVGAGVIVLLKPGNSLKALAVVTGICVLAHGILELGICPSRRTETRGFDALIGALSVIAGILLVRNPIAGITALALFLGIWLVAVGVVRFVGAFGAVQHRVRGIVVGLAEIVVGIVAVSSPHIAYATLALFVGIGLILNGGSTLVLGIAMHMVRPEDSGSREELHPPRGAPLRD